MENNGEPLLAAAIAGICELPTLIPTDPNDFVPKTLTSSTQLSKNFPASVATTITHNITSQLEEESLSGNPFSFASSATSQLVLERIMSQSQEVSPLTSGRLSHSSGPLNAGSLSDSPPMISPSDIHEKLLRVSNTPRAQQWGGGGNKTVGRWLKDRREKKKEETRAHNAHLHAAISLAGVAAAVAAIASATAAASSSSKDERISRTDMAVAAAATLVASQCVEAADSLGADREHLASVVGSAVSVRSPSDIATLTAAAATALRGAATLKARAMKEVWNIAAVTPVEKGSNADHHGHRRRTVGAELNRDSIAENFVGLCNQELLARGTELLKRTRKGALHWKVVSVYIHRTGVVMLKTKSRHVAGTFTKKKKNVVTGLFKDVEAWPGRHLLEGGEQRRYFGLRTAEKRTIEFECRSQREYEVFTIGVARLLDMVAWKKKRRG